MASRPKGVQIKCALPFVLLHTISMNSLLRWGRDAFDWYGLKDADIVLGANGSQESAVQNKNPQINFEERIHFRC